MRLGDSSSESGRCYGDAPPLTQHFVHPDVSPSSTTTPSATPHDRCLSALGGRRLGRVMIEPDGSSWHPAKDAARVLKECVRRLYTQAYHSWSEIPNSIRQAMFNNFKTMCTWESRYNLVIGTTFERKASTRLSSWLKSVRDSGERPGWMLPHVFDELGQYWNTESLRQYQIKPKWLEAVLKVARCTPEVQRWLEQLHERWKKNWDTLPLNQRFSKRLMSGRKKMSLDRMCRWRKGRMNFWGTHKGRCYGLGSRNDVRHLHSGLEGIGSSRQAEALDGVQIAAMSDQIAKLTATLASRGKE
ncbi:hypothetical protein H5410_030343 [Solanum commersonii]|uniref:Uncharacterized protein n=1 Tax=Solanum commersonii TaxID=4109 RepID=A0A9J5YFW8_SOLCO|nr:hypothetical protein H5410_030343 [Solanum commersonii]